MTTYSVNSIVCKVKKAFPCEAISEPICVEIRSAISHGVMPEFSDVECSCFYEKRIKKCTISKQLIETRLYALGITKMCEAMVKPELAEEGEWN